MKARWVGWPTALAVALATGAWALSPQTATDYLTREEVELVRDTQHPDKRLPLFLRFADERLRRFEKKLLSVENPKPKDIERLRGAIGHYISAIDDAAGTLQTAFDIGGVDLRKTREHMDKSGQDFVQRIEKLRAAHEIQDDELAWDVEDALEATQDLLALGQKIPDGPIPSRVPGVTAYPTGSKERPRPRGAPTLKRKDDKKKEKKPPL